MDTTVLQTILDSGIPPLELVYAPVKATFGGNTLIYRSALRINSLQLGVLMPEQYSEVSDHTAQGSRLALWNLRTACRDIGQLEFSGNQYQCLSVRIPTRMFLSGEACREVTKLFSRLEFAFGSRLCLELQPELLFHDRSEVLARLEELKPLGIKTALAEFGDEFCPMMRLNGLPFDVVFLTDAVGDAFCAGQADADAVVRLCSGLGYDTMLCAEITDEVRDRAYNEGCAGCQSRQWMPLRELVRLGGDSQ